MSEDFKRSVGNDLDWLIMGGISLGAAEVLWKHSMLGRQASSAIPLAQRSLEEHNVMHNAVQMSIPAFLMAGHGIEGVLKAIRVRQKTFAGEPVTQSSQGVETLHTSLKTHHLDRLADEARVPLDDDERGLLRRLSTIVTWAGRYPVSLQAKNLKHDAHDNRDKDWKIILSLVPKLYDFHDRAPELAATGPDGERIETFKVDVDRWEIGLVVDGDVVEQRYSGIGSDATQIAYDWRRQLEQKKKSV